MLCLVAMVVMVGLGRAEIQSVRITGKLLCPSAKAGEKAWLELYDEDLVGDDEIDKKTVTFNGNGEASFELQGALESGWGNIDPIFKVYHDCNDWKPCQRKFRMELPDSVISKGAVPSQAYDLGGINLEMKVKDGKLDSSQATSPVTATHSAPPLGVVNSLAATRL